MISWPRWRALPRLDSPSWCLRIGTDQRHPRSGSVTSTHTATVRPTWINRLAHGALSCRSSPFAPVSDKGQVPQAFLRNSRQRSHKAKRYDHTFDLEKRRRSKQDARCDCTPCRPSSNHLRCFCPSPQRRWRQDTADPSHRWWPGRSCVASKLISSERERYIGH